ncbi:MAG: DUF501 domain-containing protein [Bowdeniella nasicola]|nr:DUF501 domain-containing protein [Bowdeniella nasicola]
MSTTPVTDADRAILTAQLGRVPRGVIGIGARCRCGQPLVVVTAPRLEDGTPFPTFFYLTHPAIVKGVSVLEARGDMAGMNEELGADEVLATAYQRAHEDYIARREEHGQVPEIAGVSAGGMPTRVKCLHALVGHALAVGPGVNPFGDRAVELLAAEGHWSAETCVCEVTAAE